MTSAEDDTHSHSFMGLGRGEGTRPDDSLGIQRQLWPNQKLFEQGSIVNRCAGGRGREITQDARVLLTNNLGDPGNECVRTNAFGFDTGRRCDSD